MKKRLLLLTGNPGTGKTSLLLKTVEALKANGYAVGGMVSREVRSCGGRVGFEILDLGTSRHGWLAHVNQETGPQVGRYRVNLEDLERLGVDGILKAVEQSAIIAIDEIGPMELYSSKFKEAVRKAVESGKLVIGVIHRNANGRFMDELKNRQDAEVFVVNYENRDDLYQPIVGKALEFLEDKSL